MTESFRTLIWVVLFRAVQTALETAPTLLCGLFVAGIMRGMIGPDRLRNWFTRDPVVGPIRAWIAGALLPVCSFGVLPIAWELRRVGVPRGCVLTLLLIAPVINPFSLIYLFQSLEVEGLLGMAAIAFLLIGSFAITVGIGVLLGRWFPDPDSAGELPRLPGSGSRRAGVVLLTAARAMNGPLAAFLAIGILGAGLLALVPGGALERAVNDRSVTAPLHLTWVSIPFQAPPTRGMMFVCEALLSGVPVGSVFVFFLLGIGLNLGTLVWIASTSGFRICLLTVALLIGAALAIGFAVPVALPNPVSHPSKICHFLEIESSGGFKVAKARAIRTTVTNDSGEPQWFLIGACASLAGLWLIGLGSSFLGERGTVSYVMTHGAGEKADQEKSVLGQSLNTPQRTLAFVGLAVVAVVAGLYIYYPSPVDLLNEMDGIEIELSLVLKAEPLPRRHADQLASQWHRLQTKLVVADLLRRGRIDSAVQTSSVRLAVALERLRLALRDKASVDDFKTRFRESQQAARDCREAVEKPVSKSSVLPRRS